MKMSSVAIECEWLLKMSGTGCPLGQNVSGDNLSRHRSNHTGNTGQLGRTENAKVLLPCQQPGAIDDETRR